MVRGTRFLADKFRLRRSGELNCVVWTYFLADDLARLADITAALLAAEATEPQNASNRTSRHHCGSTNALRLPIAQLGDLRS